MAQNKKSLQWWALQLEIPTAQLEQAYQECINSVVGHSYHEKRSAKERASAFKQPQPAASWITHGTEMILVLLICYCDLMQNTKTAATKKKLKQAYTQWIDAFNAPKATNKKQMQCTRQWFDILIEADDNGICPLHDFDDFEVLTPLLEYPMSHVVFMLNWLLYLADKGKSWSATESKLVEQLSIWSYNLLLEDEDEDHSEQEEEEEEEEEEEADEEEEEEEEESTSSSSAWEDVDESSSSFSSSSASSNSKLVLYIKQKKSKKTNNTTSPSKKEAPRVKLEDVEKVLATFRSMKEGDDGAQSEVLNQCIGIVEHEAQVQQKLQEEENARKMKKRKELTMDTLDLIEEHKFLKKCSNEERVDIFDRVEEVVNYLSHQEPIRVRILKLPIPLKSKANAFDFASQWADTADGDCERAKLKAWVDNFLRVPFGIYRNIEVSLIDGVDTCHTLLENSKQLLDKAVYGMVDAKEQMLQFVAKWIANPTSVGNVLGLCGPPGTGKTSLVKEGFSKIVNRPFSFVSLGGMTNASTLRGHSYTYQGAICGRIVQILQESNCMNPIIFFDELDKVSKSYTGDEIISTLIHLVDPAQNQHFNDDYFAGIDFDISRCLFVFSYNDESLVHPVLLDRMFRIKTEGYTQTDKMIIGKEFMLPRMMQEFSMQHVVFPDATIHYINQTFGAQEKGVRTLKRCLETILLKLNVFRMSKPGILTNYISTKENGEVEVTIEVARELLKQLVPTVHSAMYSMYV